MARLCCLLEAVPFLVLLGVIGSVRSFTGWRHHSEKQRRALVCFRVRHSFCAVLEEHALFRMMPHCLVAPALSFSLSLSLSIDRYIDREADSSMMRQTSE